MGSLRFFLGNAGFCAACARFAIFGVMPDCRWGSRLPAQSLTRTNR